ncbi:MAG: hypothetical protein IM600_03435 [Bacteroidetes bacterium]|nr:hypothetical protein [Bacteroidota bacterium]
MLKLIVFIPIFLSSFIFSQNIDIPHGYKIIKLIEGDLNKDNITEIVVVFDTQDSSSNGKVRELTIFKKINDKYFVWKNSRNVIGGSQSGGMLGDSFENVSIENGILIISNNGGSSWKWSTTDKYSFQNNEFELIGYTTTYGKNCEYWTFVDYNLSTGKINYKKEIESCDENGNQKIIKTIKEYFQWKKLKLNLDNRKIKEEKIVTPKYKEEIYI